MGEALKVIQDLQAQAEERGGALERIDISQEMYDALVAECRPAAPENVLGIPVGILPPEMDSKTLH